MEMSIDRLVKIVGSRLKSVDEIQQIGSTWCDYFVAHGMINPDMRILDYGAGLGRLAIPFNRIAKVIALDVNSDMVQYLSTNGVEAYQATDCKSVQGLFDFAISCYVFEHNAVEDVQSLIQQIGALAPVFYFTYPTIEVFNGRFPNHYKHYKEIEKLPLLENTKTSRMMHYHELPLLLEGSAYDPNSLTWIKGIGANLFKVTHGNR